MNSYQAIVAPLTNVHKHPGADKLYLADVVGEQVIVGPEHQENDLGVFFPAGTVLSEDFVLYNNLYRKHPVTGAENKGGYLEPSNRIKYLKLRGEISRGLWLPMTCLDYLKLKQLPILGQTFDELNGQVIIQKYIDPQEQKGKPGQPKTRSKRYWYFPEIGEMGRLNYNLQRLKPGDVLYLTEKVHSTSGRTGYAKLIQRPNWIDKLLYKFGFVRKPKFEIVSGTRRTILTENTYHTKDNYRILAHKYFAPYLTEGMVIYYEICSYPAIMPEYSVDKFPDIAQKYGKTIKFSYNCKPGENKFFVYKIMIHDPNGNPYTFSFEELCEWCNLRNVQHVPILDTIIFDGNVSNLTNKVKELCDAASSSLDSSHPMEGVVVHSKYGMWKYKGTDFCLIEQIKPYSLEDEV